MCVCVILKIEFVFLKSKKEEVSIKGPPSVACVCRHDLNTKEDARFNYNCCTFTPDAINREDAN